MISGHINRLWGLVAVQVAAEIAAGNNVQGVWRPVGTCRCGHLSLRGVLLIRFFIERGVFCCRIESWPHGSASTAVVAFQRVLSLCFLILITVFSVRYFVIFKAIEMRHAGSDHDILSPSYLICM